MEPDGEIGCCRSPPPNLSRLMHKLSLPRLETAIGIRQSNPMVDKFPICEDGSCNYFIGADGRKTSNVVFDSFSRQWI